MDKNELQSEIYELFNPEPDEDMFYIREWPNSRLKDFHKLDISYFEDTLKYGWEGSSIHPDSRICSMNEDRLFLISKNQDIPLKLFEAGLKLFGDSIIDYHDNKERKGSIRYYPSVIITFWSGFETFIRYYSELMLITVKDIPFVVADYLLEREVYLDKNGELRSKVKYQAILERYILLLKYGYKFKVDRGCKHWQNLEKAKKVRDYYTHLDVSESRDLSSEQVLDYMEALMMAIIWPSCELCKTLMLGIYNLYDIWLKLREFQCNYIEQPFFKEWPNQRHMFHCNFENVDTNRFPNSAELSKKDNYENKQD